MQDANVDAGSRIGGQRGRPVLEHAQLRGADKLINDGVLTVRRLDYVEGEIALGKGGIHDVIGRHAARSVERSADFPYAVYVQRAVSVILVHRGIMAGQRHALRTEARERLGSDHFPGGIRRTRKLARKFGRDAAVHALHGFSAPYLGVGHGDGRLAHVGHRRVRQNVVGYGLIGIDDLDFVITLIVHGFPNVVYILVAVRVVAG